VVALVLLGMMLVLVGLPVACGTYRFRTHTAACEPAFGLWRDTLVEIGGLSGLLLWARRPPG
jgi:hypothetical protein